MSPPLQLCWLSVPHGVAHLILPSAQPAQGPSSPVIHQPRGSEQSRGAGGRRASPGPHRSQPLGPHCPLGLAPDLKLPIPDQAARSPHWLVPMVTLKPPGRAHKTGHKAEGWEEKQGCRLRWGSLPRRGSGAGAAPVRDLTIHWWAARPRSCFCPVLSALGELLCVLSLSFLPYEWESESPVTTLPGFRKIWWVTSPSGCQPKIKVSEPQFPHQ